MLFYSQVHGFVEVRLGGVVLAHLDDFQHNNRYRKRGGRAEALAMAVAEKAGKVKEAAAMETVKDAAAMVAVPPKEAAAAVPVPPEAKRQPSPAA